MSKRIARSADAAPFDVLALPYRRVSSDDQEESGVSLQIQEEALAAYIRRQGWEMGPDYCDVLTGKRIDRPRYQAMLADLRRHSAEGRSVVVVVPALDRLGRRMVEQARCLEEL